MRKIISKNPFTGQLYREFDFNTNQELQLKIKRAQQGYKVQLKRSISQRAAVIARLGNIIQKNLQKIAQTITNEMGKPMTQSEAQVKKVVSFCNYYSKNYEPLYPITLKTDAKKKTLVKFLPLGIIHYIVPFNFPFYLNFKGGLPNLLLGNSLLVRNADSCPQVGLLVQDLMKEAGFDSGEYVNVHSHHDQLDLILSHNSVGGVSFTGSSKAGSFIAEKAGKYLKRSVMQLGGNDPFIVLPDADLQLAIADAIRGRHSNAGQVCFSPKRFIVVQPLYEKFKSGLIDGLAHIKYGDPMDRDTKMGPLARHDLLENLKKQISQIPKSYKVIYQRTEMTDPFFPITVIEGTDQLFDQEKFGPVFTLFKAKDQKHAIELANSGSYGLAASVYSKNRGQEVIDQVRSGMGFVNEVAKSDYTMPSGGVGKSGYGRQCWIEGYRQFANVKLHYEN